MDYKYSPVESSSQDRKAQSPKTQSPKTRISSPKKLIVKKLFASISGIEFSSVGHLYKTLGSLSRETTPSEGR